MRHGRIAVSLLFLLYGTVLGAWTARIPAVKAGLGLSDGELSLGLLAFAAGAITGMQAMGPLADRFGAARLMAPVALADGALLVTPAYAGALWTLCLALYAFGTAHGMLNIAMNAHAVEVERAWGRPIMSSFHAVYSIGGFAGAAIGGLFAATGRSAAATFLTVAALAAAVAGAAGRWRWRSTPDRVGAPSASDRVGTGVISDLAGAPSAGRRGASHGVFFLGVLAFCCLVGEGAAADWSAVYLRDTLGSSAGFAASAYAAFAIMMTAGRLAGDRLATALGPVRLVRWSGVLAAAGLATGLLIDHPVAGVTGFACLGAGLSCIAPQVFSAAGNRHPARAGQAIARVASMGFLGFVVGPLVIGAAAEWVGLGWALAVPAVLALFVAAAAPSLRARPGVAAVQG